MKNSADLGGCYPPRPSASLDNTLLDLQNSSYPTQPHSIIANSQREIKEISTLKNSPFPVTLSINVHRRALQVLLLCLIPCHRCEKWASGESRNCHHLITERENIHPRTHDTCLDKRRYMTSGWCNLF